MSNVNSLISERLKKNPNSTKMSTLARQSASGHLTSFSGVFSVTELNDSEKLFFRKYTKRALNWKRKF